MAQAILRRTRLDFGDTLYFPNDEGAFGTENAGDDYYDEPGVIWGDSCIHSVQEARVRVASPAAWTPAGSSTIKASRSTEGDDDWSFVTTSFGYTIAGKCRIGVVEHDLGTERYQVWHLRTDGKVYLSVLDWSSGWSWNSHSAGYTLTTSPDACAIHPVGEITVSGTDYYAAILVAVKGTSLYAQWLMVDQATKTSWTAGAETILRLDAAVDDYHCHWSDAERIDPDDSDMHTYCVLIRATSWGSTRCYTYSRAFDKWSQGRELYPSQELFGNMRVTASALSRIDGRLWAVTSRELVGTDDLIYAPHVALCSSPDGAHWRDEYYVTCSVLRGKLLYVDGDTYCHVVGNASVARAQATIRLGQDASALKHTFSEVTGFQFQVPGVSTASALNLSALTAGTSFLSLLEPGNQLTLSLGAYPIGTYPYILYATTDLHNKARSRASGRDELDVSCFGQMARVIGDNAYRLPSAKYYDSPYCLYSHFVSDDGNALLNVRTVTGTWVTLETEEGGYVLHCSTAGISLIPYQYGPQGFVFRSRFQFKVYVKDFWQVFWYEDALNYWRAGLILDSSVKKLAIQKITDGVASNKGTWDTDPSPSLDTWYTLYVEVTANRVRAWYNESDSFDFVASPGTVTYNLTESDGPLPTEYHVGYEVVAYEDDEGAESTGTVDSADDYTLTDSGAFTGDLAGYWVRCNDQDREIISNTDDTITTEVPWSVVPEAGSDYAIYTATTIEGPQIHVSEIFASEGLVPWSVDEIADDVLEMCGVERWPFFDGDVGTRTSGPRHTRDLDLLLETTLINNTVTFWASSTDATVWSGYKLYIYTNTAKLTQMNYTPGSGQSEVTLARHPLAYLNDGATGMARLIRIQAWEDKLFLSINGRLATCFPLEKAWPAGYCWRDTTGTGTIREFSTIEDGFIWDSNELSSSVVERLLRERKAKMIETVEGSIVISRFEDGPLADAGDYTHQQVRIDMAEVGAETVSLIEMAGAWHRSGYLDPLMARRRLRYVRIDSPMATGLIDTLVDARRAASLAYGRSSPAVISLHIADPQLSLENLVGVTEPDDTVTHYRTESLSFSLVTSVDQGPQVQASFRARLEDERDNPCPPQTAVLDRLSTPPGSPSKGDRYLIVATASGDWAGYEDYLAEWTGMAWYFEAPGEGLHCWVADEVTWYEYDSGSWGIDGTYSPAVYDGGWTYG